MSNRTGLEIRAATGADAAGLAELMGSCGTPISARDLAERLEALGRDRGTALIALEWGPPSGLVVLHWHRSLEAAAPLAHITTLIVGPDDRRRGIGRLLLKAAARAARSAGCDSIRICAEPPQDDLRAFCAATGFAQHATSFVRPLRKQ